MPELSDRLGGQLNEIGNSLGDYQNMSRQEIEEVLSNIEDGKLLNLLYFLNNVGDVGAELMDKRHNREEDFNRKYRK